MADTQPKRRRLDSHYELKKKRRREANGGSQNVGIDALPWGQAKLPDRLDDAEGFFGLEEISDVEVVRDPTSGRVEYRLPESTGATHAQDGGVDQNGHRSEDDSWSGFGDSDSGDGPAQSKSGSNNPQLSTASVPKKAKKKANAKLVNSNVFELLRGDSVDDADVSAWNHLDLSSEVLTSIAKLRFVKPTAIQSSTIPEILDGHDVIGKASTGSGKTLAFGIPILEHYLKNISETQDQQSKTTAGERQHPPAALILSPTRELAHQLSAHLTDLCSNISSRSPNIATITGGLSLQKQERVIANADIIIGTPGRLWEIINSSKGLMPWLTQTKFLVLDEADRLLTEGHYKELEEILNALDRTTDDDQPSPPANQPTDRQTLIFSATFAPSLQSKLSGHQKKKSNPSSADSLTHLISRLNFRSTPKFIDASPLTHLPSSLSEHIIECSALEKDLYLYALLLCHFPSTRALVFTNSINSVRRLVPFLQNLNLPVHALHSQMPQKARLRSIERFSASDREKEKGVGSILVATDVAARGLDIPNVAAVLHYHLPRAADTYVHRSGRTARKGLPGASVLICSPEEVQGMRRLVAKVHATATTTANNKSQGIRTLELDRRIVGRLKPRTVLAKQIADAGMAKEKKGHEDKWLRDAAEELGVDYDSEEFEKEAGGMKGKGHGRRKKEEKARGLSKGEVGGMKAELRGMLARRVNVGVSERYLSAGGLDVEELLEGGGRGDFLGRVDGLN
ncbi:MAG: hypothetical protein Q9208_003592 [Pyrenodesmia sp. 3 TL-2023]